jgi:iron-sulfur cluster assembly protein
MSAITITEDAAAKVRELTAKDDRQDLALRLFVTSGGCSGFNYGMTLDDEIADDDSVTEDNGVKILVDADSLPYVLGSEIHYVDSMMGAGFVVNNPNATGGCGCGQSFRTDGASGQARSCAH